MDWLNSIGQDLPPDNYIESLNVGGDDPEVLWQQDRLGKFTSSRMGDLMKSGRAKDKIWGDTAMGYIYEKIAEKLTGIPHFIPETRSIAWGNDHEAEAIQKYNEKTGNGATPMGKTFIEFNDNCGGSPDGFIDDDGIIEVKCPYNSANHLKTLIEGYIDKDYMFQMQSNMLFSNRDYCDFISYDPRLPEAIQLVVIRVGRDEEICNAIAERITLAAEKILEIQEKTGIELKITI